MNVNERNSQKKMNTDKNGPIACNKCGQTFTQRGNLNRHMRLHTGQFKFYCNKCKKGFADITHYNQHMRSHEGLKYHCDYCAKPFSSKHRYQYHLSVHTGSYKFVCELCNKRFNEKQIYYKRVESCKGQNRVLHKRDDRKLIKTLNFVFTFQIFFYKSMHVLN